MLEFLAFSATVGSCVPRSLHNLLMRVQALHHGRGVPGVSAGGAGTERVRG